MPRGGELLCGVGSLAVNEKPCTHIEDILCSHLLLRLLHAALVSLHSLVCCVGGATRRAAMRRGRTLTSAMLTR